MDSRLMRHRINKCEGPSPSEWGHFHKRSLPAVARPGGFL